MDKAYKRKLVWLGMDAIVTIMLICLDQWTKQLALKCLQGKDAFVLWKNVFELDYLENRGSAFGMFQNKKIFLLIVGILLMGLVMYAILQVPNKKRYIPLHVFFSLLAAGGIGNMIDRLWNGYVVDFFSFVLIHFPVFNVADVYIVIAAFMIGILFIFVYQDDELSFLWPGKSK